MQLNTSLGAFPGIGPARLKALGRLGLFTAADLLRHFPRDYEDRSRLTTIAAAVEGEPVCIRAMVAETPRLSHIRKGLDITKVKVVDEVNAMTVTFFNQSYIKDALRPGESYTFYGKVEGYGRARQMLNPIFEPENTPRFTGCIMPIYALTQGITNNLLSGLTRRALEGCLPQVEETLPNSLRQAHNLAALPFSYRHIHFPGSFEELALARRRLIFEELFYLTCGLAFLKGRRGVERGPVLRAQPTEEFTSLLPFAPTGAQRRTMAEIAADTSTGRPMNRLLQGDVGSGKTVVAAYGAWLAHQSGFQSALMAPTEILAQQHFATLSGLLSPAGMKVALLTGSMKAAEKKKVYAALETGEIHLIVGTHALLSEGVSFHRLGLVVTDEQHRFGVAQRSALAAKSEVSPHVLVMSATPIPRTLALIIYGDLDVSVLDELPPGRTPVETYLVGEDKRQRMYNFVRKLVSEGRQAYIVCPMVEEQENKEFLREDFWHITTPMSSTAELKAVTAYTKQLQTEVFPDLKVAFVHGKMKPMEKETVMAAFAAGETHVLVSTTVIEVGVDVPNAALMIIENAERFGLSQLHQLRGRVGRGKHQSYCVLLSDTKNPDTRERLKVMTRTTDGFVISEEDLKARGPGDFFGKRQHGLPQLRIADLTGDMRLLKEAQQAAEDLLQRDPTLSRAENRRVLEQVRRLFAENPDIFN